MTPRDGLNLVLDKNSRFALFANMTGFGAEGCAIEIELETSIWKRNLVVECAKLYPDPNDKTSFVW